MPEEPSQEVLLLNALTDSVNRFSERTKAAFEDLERRDFFLAAKGSLNPHANIIDTLLDQAKVLENYVANGDKAGIEYTKKEYFENEDLSDINNVVNM